jgi:tetratricopeptide (TPR) repeat protein
VTVPPDYFEAAMDRLRETLDAAPEVVVTPMPRSDASIITRSTHRLAQLKRILPEQLRAEERFQRAFTRLEHDHEARIVDFSEALDINPKYVAAYLHRSASRRIAGDLDGAIADASEVIKLQAAEPNAYTARGIAYYLRGDVDEAIADYSEALRLQPYDAAALINRGDARRASGYFEGALADYSGAIDRSPVTREDYYAFCQKFALSPSRNIPDTLALFNRLRFIAYNNRGEIRRIQKDMPGAIQDFTAALGLAPDNGNALLNRAESRMQMDDMSGAILDLTYALESDPQNATLFHQRGFAWHEKGNNEAALEDYASALTINPRSPMTYCNRAEIYLEHDDYEAALADWNTAHELRPGNRLVLAGLALTHHGMGNIELAAEVWRLLTGADDRFKDADEVAKLLNWKAPLVAKTRAMLLEIS